MVFTKSIDMLTFEDIEPNLNISSGTFRYSPQDSVGLKIDTTLQQGESLLLSAAVGGSSNNYQWMKNEVDIPGATDSVYNITSADTSSIGVFICKIKSDIVTELTIYSNAVKVAVEGLSVIESSETTIPNSVSLQQNYPNPFNPTTTISYQLPAVSQVNLSVYNVSGQKVATLVSGKQTVGRHQVKWNASAFASGVYLYKLTTDKSFTQTKKLILLK